MEGQYGIAQKVYKEDSIFAYQKKRFGARYIEYRKAFDSPVAINNIPSFPLYIRIETTHKCNLNCVTCFHGVHFKDMKSEFDRKFTHSIMSMKVLDAILEQAKEYGLPSIGLNWLGEPTLAKDIDLRISKCVDAGIMDVLMSSNGILVDENLAERMIKAGLTHMLFSVDAATEETYKLLRPNGNFKKLNDNIVAFIALRNKINKGACPRTRVSLVPTKINQQEINKFVQKYSKIVDYVEIQPFGNLFKRLDDLVPENAEKVKFMCGEVFDKLNIDTNGDVYPCCSHYGRDIILGNVIKDDLKDIFVNSPILQMLRNEAFSGDYSLEECKFCQDSMYKYVDKIDH